ncbi:diacylglycerol O-acyltransferase 1 [Aspergillus fumigatus]
MSGQENLQAGSLQQQPESAIQSSSSGKVSLSPKTQMEQNTSCVNHVQSGSKYRDFVANNTDLSDADFDSPVKRIDNLAILSSHDKSQPGVSCSEPRRHAARSRGIRWAPLNIGIERRMQTFVVLCHTLTIAIFLTVFFFACALPVFWPLLLPYLVYISLFSSSATSGTLSGRSNFMRSLSIWSLYASYFPACLHRSEALLPTRKYIFGYHPHGIISHGAFAAFATEALGFSRLFPGITNTLLTLDSNFRIPFYREYALAMGLASVSRESCENLLSKGGADGEGMGRAITIVIVLAFGENDLYEQVRSDQHPIIHKLQMLIKRTMGFTVPLFHARGVFNYDVGLMPYRRPLNIVVGRPIQVVQQRDRDKIDETYIDDLHAKYIQELRRLWEQYKDVFAKDRISEIEIVA